MEHTPRRLPSHQHVGGIAALYLAIAYLVTIPYFLVVLNYQEVVTPAAKLELLVNHQGDLYLFNLLAYVVFGLGLTVLALALSHRLRGETPAMAHVIAGWGIIWSSLLIASGAIANIGMEYVVTLQQVDAAGAAGAWQVIESIADGLGGAGGEALGGPWVLLVSLAGLRSQRLPRALNWLGIVMGMAGLISNIPPLRESAVVFGLLIIGVLYIIGTVAGILSVVAATLVLSAPEEVARIASDDNRLVVGALLVLTMGLALALIPIVLYPLARKYSEPLALGYLVFRGALEPLAYIAMAIPWLALVSLSRGYGQVGGADAAAAPALSMGLLPAQAAANNVLVIVFSLGGLMLYTLLYRSRLVPRWLSVWGLVAICLHLATVFFVLFPRIDPMAPTLLVLNLPILVQEMVMAVWLIVRGFSASVIAATPPGPGYDLQTAHGRAGN